jgi:hypothetical protein
VWFGLSFFLQALAQGSCRGVVVFARTRHYMQAYMLHRMLTAHAHLRVQQTSNIFPIIMAFFHQDSWCFGRVVSWPCPNKKRKQLCRIHLWMQCISYNTVVSCCTKSRAPTPARDLMPWFLVTCPAGYSNPRPAESQNIHARHRCGRRCPTQHRRHGLRRWSSVRLRTCPSHTLHSVLVMHKNPFSPAA